jgi:transposase
VAQKKSRDSTPEFREAAAREVVEKSRAVADVARDCGVTDQTVRNWVKAYRATRAQGSELTPSERDRLRELEKENRKLREQLEFMGKASLDSTGQGNTFGRGAVAEAFAWPIVESVGDGVQFSLAVGGEVGFLR